MKLIGFAGRCRSGKDTAADHLATTEGYSRASFAEPLKRAAMIIFDLTADEVNGVGYDREQIHPFWGISVREMLQKLGTESVRDVFGEDHWVRLMERKLTDADAVAISDVKFDNEVGMLRRLGGTIVGLIREGGPEVRPHSSEEMAAERLHEVSDVVICADSVEALRAALDEL